ncbi:MAG: hypothetical protein H6859_10175 [Rhodospirillales bacterium]|nr:hypothetical protein [Alphaproteobacteria bacterium]USO05488.1 MAG: hypothetical protein H6859_10175 [Rhodospirillales bacterium]
MVPKVVIFMVVKAMKTGLDIFDNVSGKHQRWKERKVLAIVADAILNHGCYTPRLVSDRTEIDDFKVVNVLRDFQDRGAICILAGGSLEIVQFEVTDESYLRTLIS